MSKLKSKDELFSGRHFNRDVIILCVRWYLRYKLGLRDLVEMMTEQQGNQTSGQAAKDHHARWLCRAARRQPQVPTAPGKASFAEAAALPATESVGAGMQKSREGRTVSGPGNGGGPSSMIMWNARAMSSASGRSSR
ncbi:hypothetical protein OKW45_007152 [Paraburkholderia sp. WSM4175]